MRVYTIGEAASEVGRSVDTLRRWSKEGAVDPQVDSWGRRYFSERQIELMKRLAATRRGLVPQR